MRNTGLWKKGLVCLMITATMFTMAGCGSSSSNDQKAEAETEEAAAETPAEDVQEAETEEETVKAEAEASVEETPTEEAQTAETVAEEVTASYEGVEIDYKTSEIYTKEDMDKAIAVIFEEFKNWEGCEMHKISYTDDQKCEDNLSYIRELDTDVEYEQCIVFKSNFHSPVEGGGAWEPNYEYEDWEWYLGRTKDGDWNLLTWGY